MSARPAGFRLPDADSIHRVRFDNGLTLLFYPTPHTQSVVIAGSLDAGATFEQGDIDHGLASMTAVALLHGTQSRDFNTLHAELEDIGADLGFISGLHKVGFSGKALAEDLPTLIEILADVLRRPSFPPEEVSRVMGERLTALNYLAQDTGYRAAQAFRQMLYPPDHLYHRGTRGRPHTIERMTRDDLAAFHAAHYGGRGMILCVVGAVDVAQVSAIVGEHLADWQTPHQPQPPALRPLPAPTGSEQRFVPVSGKNQADILIGVAGPPRTAPDYHAAMLGNSVLGVFGMMGRVGASVREREGLAYYAGSRVNGGFGPGAWRISAGVDPADVERAIALCRAEIERFVSEPVTPEELADSQSYFVGSQPLQLEHNDGIANALHNMESYGLGLNYLADYREIIYSISADDILKTAQRYFQPEAIKIAIAGS
ncbi:MAG: insulinase family protein [Anaerolineaceae bacterium]|nr:MAG: insulinase family protein [Anaerolineaceae bacterium]